MSGKVSRLTGVQPVWASLRGRPFLPQRFDIGEGRPRRDARTGFINFAVIEY